MADQLRSCTDIEGRELHLPRSQFALRPAAHAIIMHEGRLLVVTNRFSGRIYLPGGGLEPGESLAEALAREVREETGISIGPPELLRFDEEFLYFNPAGSANHVLEFLFRATPLTLEIGGEATPDDGEGDPHWVAIEGLEAGHFHSHGSRLLPLIRAEYAARRG